MYTFDINNFVIDMQDAQMIVEPPISAVNQSVSFSIIMVC